MPYERDFAPLPAPEPRWRERLRQYWALVRGDRPIGVLLLLFTVGLKLKLSNLVRREIIGGSQREERLDILDARMDQFGLDREHYSWYRDFRRYGTVPHAGFGLGFERLVVYVCGLANIRDAIAYPRAPGSAEF